MYRNPITATIHSRCLPIARLGLMAMLIAVGGSDPFAQGQAIGPDAIAAIDPGPAGVWGSVNGVQGYSTIGGVCNLGDVSLPGNIPNPPYVTETNHPMWAQNFYRLSDVGFQQIGLSWVKHDGWNSDKNPCYGCDPLSTCTPCTVEGCLPTLEAGCKDIYQVCENGIQGWLGPRSQINPATGVWPIGGLGSETYCNPASSGGKIACQLQIAAVDFEEEFADARFFLEQQVITPDEWPGTTWINNVSYKEATIGACAPTLCTGFDPCGDDRACTPVGSCIHPINVPATNPIEANCQDAAIYAWGSLVSGVEYDEIQVPNDGLLILAAKVTSAGIFGYDYEYAVYNMNSDRAVRSFKLTFSDPTTVRCNRIAFHDVDYHSGEPRPVPCSTARTCACSGGANDTLYCDEQADCPGGSCSGLVVDGTDWTWSVCTPTLPPADPPMLTELEWKTDLYSDNANANALRWGTLYNFRFRSLREPQPGGVPAILGLFKPGTPTERPVTTIGPKPGLPPP